MEVFGITAFWHIPTSPKSREKWGTRHPAESRNFRDHKFRKVVRLTVTLCRAPYAAGSIVKDTGWFGAGPINNLGGSIPLIAGVFPPGMNGQWWALRQRGKGIPKTSTPSKLLRPNEEPPELSWEDEEAKDWTGPKRPFICSLTSGELVYFLSYRLLECLAPDYEHHYCTPTPQEI